MGLIYREYGQTVEITEFERSPSKVRLFGVRERRVLYGARRFDSLRRSRQICVRRVSSALKEFGRPLFITCTLRGDASDAAYASACLGRFQVRLRSRFGGCQSVFVPELSSRGRIHFHGLLFGLPMSVGDLWQGGRIISVGSERKTRGLAKLWGAGWLDARQTDGSYRLVGYISKYLTKAAGCVLFNAMHLIRISQGFPRGLEVRDAYARFFIDQLGDFLPIKEWMGENAYLGIISKKWYNVSSQKLSTILDLRDSLIDLYS